MIKRHKKTTLPIGTISSGTLRLEDLIPALASALSDLRLTRTERKIVNEALALTIDETEQCQFVYEDLEQIAQAHCPDYTDFGATEGDGAEIGVWPSMESLNEDARCTARDWDRGDDVAPRVWKINAGDRRPLTVNYVMEVTDHGNVTLYRRAGRRWIEVWSVV